MTASPESFAQSFVHTFIKRALRDARDWESGLRIVSGGRRWHVEADIPTSAQSCWLDFDVVERPDGLTVENLQALRSGTGLDASNVYAWDEHKGAWQLAADEASM